MKHLYLGAISAAPMLPGVARAEFRAVSTYRTDRGELEIEHNGASIVGRGIGRGVLGIAIALGLMATSAPAAQAEETYKLGFRNNKIEPERLEVPAGVKFRLAVTNHDKTPEEFESKDLNREKLVPPGQTVTVFLGPLKPGTYKIFGDFHQDTARGAIVAK